MGAPANKYHIADDGTVYKINDDGSFTSMGNIEDIENKSNTDANNNNSSIPACSIKTSTNTDVVWWKRNYNWLWVVTLILFLGYFFVYPFGPCAVIFICYCLSWFFSTKNMFWLKLLQIPLFACAIWCAHICEYIGPLYYFLYKSGPIPYVMWIVTCCLSIFKHRY